MIRLLPFLLLAGCQSLPSVNCDKAAKVRAAAEVALATLDRVCPITH